MCYVCGIIYSVLRNFYKSAKHSQLHILKHETNTNNTSINYFSID